MRQTLALLLVTLRAVAAEPTVTPEQLPRIPPTDVAAAVDSCSIRPGFHLELMASEPLIADPVAMAFDEDARLFVVEMRDYSERRDEVLGRVKMLTDANGDGRYDAATTFAADLAWPTAVACWDGGIFVIASPDLIYLKDTDGDGIADQRKVVATGFGKLAPKLNVQALPNNLQWGPDQRIHGALGGNPSRLEREGAPPLDLRGQDFSFDPRVMDFRAESGGGQWGMTFDDKGRKFICSNSRHLMHVRYDARFSSDLPLPPPAVDIPIDGPQAEVFRLSPDEPWRVLRTEWRATGKVKGIVEGGGRASGYFTSACGVTIYRGDAWPAEYRGNAFIADCGSNLIHRKVIKEESGKLIATRGAGEEKREFLASRDNWFRPVAFANAPDGNLWFCDMYREVVEHPWSLPESLKKHLDLNSGNDRGRIYRIVSTSTPSTPSTSPQKLSKLSTPELTALLDHPNAWHRDTAARLLHQRQDPSAAEPIAKSVHARTPPSPELTSLIQTSPKKAQPVVVPAPVVSNRAQAWDLYRPALTRKGDATRGLTIFETRCAMCHRFAGKGQPVGPDLDASRQAGREKLLGNILEPSREITAGYPLATVTKKDGAILAGIVANETPAGLLLRLPGGIDQPVKAAEIANIARSEKSLMPEGIEAALTTEQMADLLEFLAPL